MLILFKSLAVQGIYLSNREMFEAINQAIAQHKLNSIINKVFPFTEAWEAERYLKSAAQLGKVMIEIK